LSENKNSSVQRYETEDSLRAEDEEGVAMLHGETAVDKTA
jgi:hypothetical protein